MLAAAKPFASLSSGLLARKGQARPAMRRQTTLAEAGEDLGWNDMGEPVDQPAQAPLPPVLAQREELAETFATSVATAPVIEAPVATTPVVSLAPLGKRAAFTLRLDPERHLRLRLASATRGQSAQKLVTEALDAFLKTMPEVEALAESVATKADH